MQQGDQLFRLGVWQRPQQHGIDHGKNGSVSADSERERYHRDQGEPEHGRVVRVPAEPVPFRRPATRERPEQPAQQRGPQNQAKGGDDKKPDAAKPAASNAPQAQPAPGGQWVDVQTGKPAGPTFRDALETQKVCDAVLASAKKKQWVKV